MKPNTNLLLLAALTAPAFGQANSPPRTSGPIPVQSSVKVDAETTIPAAALTRPTSLDHASQTDAPRKPAVLAEERALLTAREFDRVHYAMQQDGTTWASGNTYKASFGSGGATYIPYLGSRAPRSFPLEMSLASASIDGVEIMLTPAECAVRDGDRVVIDRGPIDELYELAVDAVEQTFVVGDRLPA